MAAITSVTEFDALTTPTPATSPSAIIATNAPLYREGYNETTFHPYDFAKDESKLYVNHVLDVAQAKNAHWFCRYGILIGDATWVDFYLGVVEAVMSYRNQVTPDDGRTWTTSPDVLPDGAFPAQASARKKGVYSLHNKAIILERFATGMAELKASAFYTGARATRINTLVTQLDQFASYLATFTDTHATLHIDKFFDECGLGNQMMSVISFLQTMSNLTGTVSYQTLAATMFGKLDDALGSTGKPRFGLLVSDGFGTFITEKLEKDGIGYDGSYNSLSLELMCNYYLSLSAGAQKTAVLAIIVAMRAKLKSGVDLVTFPGTVSVAGWTRVIEDPPRMPNSTVYNWCSLAFHDRYAAAVTDTDLGLSDTIMGIGQAFGHDGEEPDPPPVTGGGGTPTGSLRLFLMTRDTRSFGVWPAMSGKALWNLDRDGPCTFPAGTYSITPRSVFGGSVELWGPSGGSGGVGATTITNGTAGSATTFTTEGTAMSAGGGGGSNGKTSNSVGNPGTGGTATGGDVNTSGSAGTSGVTGATSTAGSGGNAASPGGGTGAAGASAGAGVTAAGSQGTAPSGGASGAVRGHATNSSRRAAGGSGGGAYCQRTFAVGVLPVDVAYTLVVSPGGAAGTGDVENGAAGRDGSAVIT